MEEKDEMRTIEKNEEKIEEKNENNYMKRRKGSEKRIIIKGYKINKIRRKKKRGSRLEGNKNKGGRRKK